MIDNSRAPDGGRRQKSPALDEMLLLKVSQQEQTPARGCSQFNWKEVRTPVTQTIADNTAANLSFALDAH